MHPFPLNSNAGSGKWTLTFPGMTKNDADLLKNAWANVVKEFIEDLLRRRKVVVAVYGARPRDWDVLKKVGPSTNLVCLPHSAHPHQHLIGCGDQESTDRLAENYEMMFEILGGEVFSLSEPWLRPGINSLSLKKDSPEHKAKWASHVKGNIYNVGNAKGANKEQVAAMEKARGNHVKGNVFNAGNAKGANKEQVAAMEKARANMEKAQSAWSREGLSRKRKRNGSFFTGVHWNSLVKKWGVVIWKKVKMEHLGFFDEEKEAALKYDGEAAPLGYPLNFPKAGAEDNGESDAEGGGSASQSSGSKAK